MAAPRPLKWETLKVSEGAAYGAALQALWCWRLQQGERVTIQEITDQFVELNPGERAEPDGANADVYAELQELQNELSRSLLNVFKQHRTFVTRSA